jgi:hypothetical protein
LCEEDEVDHRTHSPDPVCAFDGLRSEPGEAMLIKREMHVPECQAVPKATTHIAKRSLVRLAADRTLKIDEFDKLKRRSRTAIDDCRSGFGVPRRIEVDGCRDATGGSRRRPEFALGDGSCHNHSCRRQRY